MVIFEFKIHSIFYDLALGLSLTEERYTPMGRRKRGVGDDDAGAPPPPFFVTSKKGMPFGFMNKNPRRFKFTSRRKVLRRQMFGALRSAHDRVHVEVPEK